MHGSLSEAGPESSDRRVGTKEFGAESWDRGSVRSLPEVGPQSSDLRVGTRELRPEIWDRGWTGVRRRWNRCWEQRVGTISWDQRVGTRELGPESCDQEVGPESRDRESWDQRGGTREVELGPEGVTGGRRGWDGSPPEVEPMLGAESWDH